jgi:putative membrane protein
MVPVALSRLAAGLAALLPWEALAHAPGDPVADPWRWNGDPWLIGPLLLAAAVYAHGCLRLARKAGRGRGLGRARQLAFAGGWILLAAALLSPIDTLGGELFWVHMIQHEILMGVAAPLLVLSRPLEAYAWGLPRGWPRALRRASRGPLLRWIGGMQRPLAAWMLHAVAIWAWHVPALFNLALADEGVHTLQHFFFFATGLAFWQSVWRRGRNGEGVALASLFTTMLHMGVLGALLTFAPTAWFDFPATGAYGLTPVGDQQLGGLVMWVPGGLPYLVAALAIFGRYIGGFQVNEELRHVRAEHRGAAGPASS